MGSIFYLGSLLGGFVAGLVTDKTGRRMATIGSVVIGAAFQTVGAWMPDFYSYTTTRFLAAIG